MRIADICRRVVAKCTEEKPEVGKWKLENSGDIFFVLLLAYSSKFGVNSTKGEQWPFF
ncbi:hypothetical protein QG37_07256 [Candidozyma auris]|uniref:Uncharacterized protein n=1 Tax=Candidozyma auris TaxID=498019 RepID=A0A0L0NQD2_CANAR|nr:hypothetical protein QG37_07256 [[Candida] auris]